MPRGTVKWFSNEKGYGFISVRGEKDVFVHYTHIEMDGFRTLDEGQQVEFRLVKTQKGQHAENVRVINPVSYQGSVRGH